MSLDSSLGLANALSKYCQMDLYCPSWPAEQEEPAVLDALEDNVGRGFFGKYRVRDIRNIVVYRKLCERIRRKNYDVMHFQSAGTIWMRLFWYKWRHIPLVITVHDPNEHPGMPLAISVQQGLAQRLIIKKASKIIVHGSFSKQQLLQKYRSLNPNDIKVVPLGPNIAITRWKSEATQHTKQASGPKRILFFGSDRPNKGLEYLLRAEPYIRRSLSNYKIIVAGKCCRLSDYRSLVQNSSNIILINEFISSRAAAKIFAESTVVVVPYVSGTQSGIIPLAYAFGKPVIATNVGAMREVVLDGQTGVLVEPRSEKALADAIASLLSNEDKLAQMGRMAHEFSERLSWEAIGIETLEVYRAAATSGSRRPTFAAGKT